MRAPLHALPFAGALLLLITGLAMNVTRLRWKRGIILGDGGDRSLGMAIRAHGNALEHGLLLAVALVLAEVAGFSTLRVVAVGWASLAGRVAHAAGFLWLGPKLSQAAMVVTYALELWLGAYLLSLAFR